MRMLGQRQRAVLGALAAHGGWRVGDAPIVGLEIDITPDWVVGDAA